MARASFSTPESGRRLGSARLRPRRGTVLVMVVALLGMIFVVGVAFLQSVTFDARQIASENNTRYEEAAIDMIERGVFDTMTKAWLSEDGSPYQMSGSELVECIGDNCADVNLQGTTRDDYKTVWPTSGELPYLHLITPVEPHLVDSATDAKPVVPYTAALEASMREDYPVRFNHYFDNHDLYSVRIDLNDPPTWAVDANGDGIPDSAEIELSGEDSPIIMPSQLRSYMLDRLNLDGVSSNGVSLSLVAIPHGAMVDMNWSHISLVAEVFPEYAEFGSLLTVGMGGPYPPEIEEAALRNRGGLPPRRMPESSLHREFVGELLAAVSGEKVSEPSDELYDRHRWWTYSVTEMSADNGEVPFWFAAMQSPTGANPNFEAYDRRHLITTCSSDSLFMRSGIGEDGVGWIEKLRADQENPVEPDDFGKWYLDDYPESARERDVNDIRLGRIMVSLPTLERSLLGAPEVGSNTNGVDSLPTRLSSNDLNAKRFVRTIQEGFALMLRNSAGKMSGAEKERTAAALTANLIDFADSDDMPTRVAIIDSNGTSKNEYVYGLERQPFITEVYTKVVGNAAGDPDATKSYSAVELYNPYGVPLVLNPPSPATQFELAVNDETPIQLTGTIPAGGYLTVITRNISGAGGTGSIPGAKIVDGDLDIIVGGDTVSLTRGHGGADVMLDSFTVASGGDFYGGGTLGDGEKQEETQERAMWRPVWTTARWSAVVPMVKADSGHSLGKVNIWEGTNGDLNDPQIVRPVQVDFANTGSMATAFPTTGTMLLLMRYANSETVSFNDAGYLTSNESDAWKQNQYQIDNGHMPVFDVAGNHRRGQSAGDHLGVGLPMGYDRLPWGQYLFDYFTALPLDNERYAVVQQGEVRNVTPQVDLSGARVRGRININAAPWTVMAGLPLIKTATIPEAFRSTIGDFVYGQEHMNQYSTKPEDEPELPIGPQLAKAIVAYRDMRRIPDNPQGGDIGAEETGDYTGRAPAWTLEGMRPFSSDLSKSGYDEIRVGPGFLTVGELANVRHWDIDVSGPAGNQWTDWRIDSGVVGRKFTAGAVNGYPSEDYVQAVGYMVALGDWVTTRSNVWTISGTLRGNRNSARDQLRASAENLSFKAATRAANSAVDKIAIRFEETVDRLPSFLQPGSQPRRIGPRRVEAYNGTR